MNHSVSVVRRTFPALTHAPFRWFWFGQMISLVGTWTQNIGQAWLVLQLTNSPFRLGIVTAMQFMPMLLFSLVAGAWIDRLPKRRIVIITQIIFMVLAFGLALLVWSGFIQYWILLVFAFLLGLTNTLDVPARQSFIIELVGKEDLANAIALNSAIFNGARLVGPALAGVIMGLWGPVWCFFINGLSFIGVVAILIFMPLKTSKVPKVSPIVLTDLSQIGTEIKEGLGYIRKTPMILLVMLMLGFLSIIAMNTNVLIPVLAKLDLGEEALGFGLLMSAMGLGAMIGALTVAVKSTSGPQLRLLLTGAIGMGIFSILTGLMNGYWGSALMLMGLGWSTIVFTSSANSLVQITVENRYRGRVMSVYSLVFGGMIPIGSLYSGTLADIFGAKITFGISGLISIAFVIGIIWLIKNHAGGEKRENRSTI